MRVLVSSLAAVFTLSLLAACGGSSSNSVTSAPVVTTDPPPTSNNQAPEGNADQFSLLRNSTNNGMNVLLNDSDPDNEPVRLSDFPAMTEQGGALRRIDNGTPNDLTDDGLAYDAPDQSSDLMPSDTDSFVYTISDAAGAQAMVSVDIELQDRLCAARDTRAAETKGYCFDAFFNTEHDGTLIDMTVYVPHPDTLAAIGGFAPLIIHSHGFGGAKQADFTNHEHFVDYQAAELAWDSGYFVISFSQRGFGDSGAEIGLMNPALEGLDTNEVVDWAIKHIRGASGAGNDSIFEFVFDENNAEHISSTGGDARPSLIRNDDGNALQPGAMADAGDPALGALGYSYGGGFQYTASRADTATKSVPEQRWDALIPEGTWSDLRYSLHDTDTPKTAWITLLTSFAITGSQRPLPQVLVQARTEADVLGQVSPALLDVFRNNSTVQYCDPVSGVTTNADVFHIQGFRDTLFDFTDGYDDVSCFERNTNNDVRFLVGIGGHPLPALTQGNYTGHDTSMDIDEIVHCALGFDADGDGDTGGQERLVVRDLMFGWFEEKLRGQAGAADAIPKVCIVQENTDASDQLVESEDNYHPADGAPGVAYPKEGIVLNSVADIPLGASSADFMFDFTTSVNVSPQGVSQGVSQFVPVYTVPDGESRVMAGIPLLQASFASLPPPAPQMAGSPAAEPIVFAGIGVMRGGELIHVHEQLTPLRDVSGISAYPYQNARGVNDAFGNAEWHGCPPNDDCASLGGKGRLAGISIRLLPGDQVGPLFFGAHEQYATHGARTAAMTTITGNIELPIFAPSALPESNNP